jgi:hypothetical protein
MAKKKKQRFYKNGTFSEARGHTSVDDSLNAEFGIPVVNPRKKTQPRPFGKNSKPA